MEPGTFGIAVQDLTPGVAEQLGVDGEEGAGRPGAVPGQGDGRRGGVGADRVVDLGGEPLETPVVALAAFSTP